MPVFTPAIALQAEDLAGVAALQRPGKVGQRISAMVPDLLDMVAAEGLITPSFVYQTRRVVAVDDGVLHLDCQSSLHAPLIIDRLPKVGELAVAVCTIGGALGGRVDQWFAAKKGLQAFVLDEIGNAAVSKVAMKMRHQIRRDAATRKLDASSSISPGAVGFETDQQQVLCQIAQADKMGIEVHRGGMMRPGKSVSFVVGLGQDMPRWTQAEECQYCQARQRCQHRVHVGGEAL